MVFKVELASTLNVELSIALNVEIFCLMKNVISFLTFVT